VDRDSPGWLVLTDMWFPSWTCTLDGETRPIYPGNYLFRAVPVPAGQHELVFRLVSEAFSIVPLPAPQSLLQSGRFHLHHCGAFAMSPGAADLNLLFGIMVVQNDFVSRDALIEAMNAWVLNKLKPLGDILVERGALSPERNALLAALVAEHIKAHHNDP